MTKNKLSYVLIHAFKQKSEQICSIIPARYGTLCGVTSNLSLKHTTILNLLPHRSIHDGATVLKYQLHYICLIVIMAHDILWFKEFHSTLYRTTFHNLAEFHSDAESPKRHIMRQNCIVSICTTVIIVLPEYLKIY